MSECPQLRPPAANIAISLLHLADLTEITRTLQISGATGPACSATYRYETGITNNFADPVG